MSDLTGKTLGRYRIVERIGRGGMADVYKAYQPSLDRYVAIKVLHPFLLEEDGSRERFQREARAVAALRHPNIVQVFDFEAEGDDYFMVMEYIDGPNLKAVLQGEAKAGQWLALNRIEEIITAIGGALAYAHHQGMIHRDIKPHNIMFTAKGQPLLTDFGIAKIISGSGSMLSMSGALTGTPAYMSPEQGRGAPLDSRTDIYSLGVVLYEMITGRVPFDADTPFAVVIKHISDPLPLPHTIRADVPDALERVVLKAMAKEPDERYQTVEEMVRAVQQAVAVAQTADLSAQAPATPVTHLLADMTGAPAGNTQPAGTAGSPTPTLPTMPVPPPEPAAPQTTPVPPPVPATALLADATTATPTIPAPPLPPRTGAQAAFSIGKVSCSLMVGVAVLVLVAVSSLAFLNRGNGSTPPALTGATPPTSVAAGGVAPTPLDGALTTEATELPGDTTPPTDTPADRPTEIPTAPTTPPTTGALPTFATLAEALQAGDGLLDDKKYAAALAAYRAALTLDTTNTAALLGIGRAQLGLGQYQAALDALNGALNAQPADLVALLARSRTYLLMGDWTRAYADANTAYAADPTSVEALTLRARANGLRGDTAAAEADYQTALTAQPDDPTIYASRGELYLALSPPKIDEAVADFQKATTQQPGDATFWVGLGKAYAAYNNSNNQAAQALTAFNKAVEIDPQSQEAYYERGLLYLRQLGDPANALTDLDRAVEIGPTSAQLYLDRATCKGQLNDDAGQLADLNQAVNADTTNPDPSYYRAVYYYYHLDYAHALTDISRAIQIAPDYYSYYLDRSGIYLMLEDYPKAEADARHALTTNPQEPAVHISLARALAYQGADAPALAEIALALSAQDAAIRADALALRGEIELRAGQTDQAAADFAEVLKAAPYNRLALLGQAAVNIAAKQYDAALLSIEAGIGQDSRYGLGYLLRARVEAAQGQPVKAIADLQQARQLILYPDERKTLEELLTQIKP